MTKLWAVLVLAAVAPACSRKPPNATPEGAVKELAEHLRRTSIDPQAAKAAYDLLAKSTQANLSDRAERYAAASGKHIPPEAMIAPSSLLERFEAHDLHAEIRGSHALVHAQGLLPDESADIPCVYEGGGWRIEITLPNLPPVMVSPRTPQ